MNLRTGTQPREEIAAFVICSSCMWCVVTMLEFQHMYTIQAVCYSKYLQVSFTCVHILRWDAFNLQALWISSKCRAVLSLLISPTETFMDTFFFFLTRSFKAKIKMAVKFTMCDLYVVLTLTQLTLYRISNSQHYNRILRFLFTQPKKKKKSDWFPKSEVSLYCKSYG